MKLFVYELQRNRYICLTICQQNNIHLNKVLKLRRLQDPGLAEFVYTIISTSSLAELRQLPEKFFSKTRTEKAAKRFSVYASEDQKVEFLNYLGYKRVLIVSNISSVWNQNMKSVLDKFEEKQKTRNLDDIFNDGLYVTSDKETVLSLTQLGSYINTKVYRQQMELMRSTNGKPTWSAKLDNPRADEFEDIQKGIQFMAEILYSGIDDLVLSELYFDLQPLELKILLFYFLNKKKYVSHDSVAMELRVFAAKASARSIIRKLLEGLYVQAHFDVKKKECTITARGMRTILSFLERSFANFKPAA